MPLLSTFGAASARSFGGIGAAAGGFPDPDLSSLLAERNASYSSNSSATIVKTDNANKFILLWYSNGGDYYRGAVLTYSSGSWSIGSDHNLIYNRNFSDQSNAGWRWDSNFNAAVGVGIDDNSDEIKALFVTYSGNSLYGSVSQSIENANSYKTPKGPYGAGCIYNPTDNCYFAIYCDSYNVYARPFTVTGSGSASGFSANVTLGTRRSLGVTHQGYYYANSVYRDSTKDLAVVCQRYNGGSGHYWNTISTARYGGGSNGSFTSNTSNSNYNTIRTSTHNPEIAYNEEEDTFIVTSRRQQNQSKEFFMPITINSSGSVSGYGSVYWFNESDPTTPPSGNTSQAAGCFYDPVSKALIIREVYSSSNTRLYQVRLSGTTVSEFKQFATLTGSASTQTAVEYDSSRDKTLFVYNNVKNPQTFPTNWVSVRSLSG